MIRLEAADCRSLLLLHAVQDNCDNNEQQRILLDGLLEALSQVSQTSTSCDGGDATTQCRGYYVDDEYPIKLEAYTMISIDRNRGTILH